MPTNDNIRKLEKILHDDFLVTPLLMIQLEAEVDKEARSDAANQIFGELDKFQVEQQGAITYVDIGIEDYRALKKQFKVD